MHGGEKWAASSRGSEAGWILRKSTTRSRSSSLPQRAVESEWTGGMCMCGLLRASVWAAGHPPRRLLDRLSLVLLLGCLRVMIADADSTAAATASATSSAAHVDRR